MNSNILGLKILTWICEHLVLIRTRCDKILLCISKWESETKTLRVSYSKTVKTCFEGIKETMRGENTVFKGRIRIKLLWIFAVIMCWRCEKRNLKEKKWEQSIVLYNKIMNFNRKREMKNNNRHRSLRFNSRWMR